jgi:hypothetical protein
LQILYDITYFGYNIIKWLLTNDDKKMTTRLYDRPFYYWKCCNFCIYRRFSWRLVASFSTKSHRNAFYPWYRTLFHKKKNLTKSDIGPYSAEPFKYVFLMTIYLVVWKPKLSTIFKITIKFIYQDIAYN